jgi:hypothetical protein
MGASIGLYLQVQCSLSLSTGGLAYSRIDVPESAVGTSSLTAGLQTIANAPCFHALDYSSLSAKYL